LGVDFEQPAHSARIREDSPIALGGVVRPGQGVRVAAGEVL